MAATTRFSATGNLAALINITVDGGAGNDTILGSNGADLLLGGDGNDFIDGQQGNDVAFLGAGNDVFQWDPGDGSDVVEGQDGTDTMLFNGSAGERDLRRRRRTAAACASPATSATSSWTLNDVETRRPECARRRRHASPSTTCAAPTSREVNVNLAGTIGGTAGDGTGRHRDRQRHERQRHHRRVRRGTSVSVVGLPAAVNVTEQRRRQRFARHQRRWAATTASLPRPCRPASPSSRIDGGAGNDTILGSQGADVLLGGDGNDFIFGDNGNDVAFLGAGDDVFQWDPGDGNDTIEGQDGIDTMLFFGANASREHRHRGQRRTRAASSATSPTSRWT